MNRNIIVLNAPVIFFGENEHAKEFCLIILTVLSTLNDEIIKHDPCTLHEDENMSEYPHILMYLTDAAIILL